MNVLATLLLAVGAAQDEPLVQRFDPTQDVGIDQALGARVPLDVPLRDEAGNRVTLGDHLGERPAVLALVYYECPMLCTLVLNGVMDAARTVDLRPGRDYDLIVLSIDPDEGPALAAAKRASYVENSGIEGAEEGFHFLTADDRAAVDRIADAIGFRYVRDTRTGEYAHASGIAVTTAEGTVSRYLFGVEYAPRDLRLALVEASEGRVGDLADRVLLLCYAYDPTTGRYGLAIMGTIRALGGGTVLVLVGFVAHALLRERRRRASP